ncbi:Oidioi.mRNA.OKI2018_I69.chr2.g5001.t1.cds [Oikopleura dioica]|uniref:Oidioi.mRNA.OKI2018_I69.chr2.g5001.t1.cds n=1 Tax=Oikopleura dioica TaxID=34765 RepID=A0ABN7T0Q9_OIKDI|nr:Oidioi.mRNA.OKI2018_I69.chr2.g5001.t1.cds [Oikopleura dioica]
MQNEANDRHMACASDCHCQEQCESRYINEQLKCEHIHDENLIPLCYENAWELFENCMLGNCDIKVTTTAAPSSTRTTTTMVSSTTTVTPFTSTSTDQPEGSSDFDYYEPLFG